ncbi:MAG TPA: hypothetical protein VMH91_00420 [Candidatus Paceibacterota bacterium]|nr:hypothetical protein [Candidatus Paceibacterota bacterium]
MSALGSSGIASGARRAVRGARWVLLIVVLAYVADVAYSYSHVHQAHLAESASAEIETQVLTMNDVDGNHLPPPSATNEADASVAGMDVNGNGIRDDVELAIFAKYPTSTIPRAAELQYALALQTMLTKVFDPETWKAAAVQEGRGYQCIGKTYPRTDLQTYLQIVGARVTEVEDLEFNTSSRVAAKEKAFGFTTSYALPADNFCDLDPSTL